MKTILLVEDNKEIIHMVQTFLEMNGYKCLLAENGQEGIELARRHIPDLIISDIMMPEVDGFLFKEQLSNNPVTSIIPFIFLSALTENKTVRKGMGLGADDYLYKPFKLAELAAVIELQLKKRETLLKDFIAQTQPAIETAVEYDQYIMIKDKGNPRFISPKNIYAIIADEKYTRVVLDSGEKIIVSKSMKEWEQTLPPVNFIRIHRSYIVNLASIEKTEKWFNRSYMVKIKNLDTPLYISKRYYSKLKDVF